MWKFHSKDEKSIGLFGKMWKLDVPKTAHYPILNKYQIALTLAGKDLFDKGTMPYQNVHNIIQLRNYLMHYGPEWIVVKPGKGKSGNEHKFSKIFKGKFPENPLTFHNSPFFPDKCLGHGCAEWAVKNCLEFTDEFFQKMEIPAPYDAIRKDLATQ